MVCWLSLGTSQTRCLAFKGGGRGGLVWASVKTGKRLEYGGIKAYTLVVIDREGRSMRKLNAVPLATYFFCCKLALVSGRCFHVSSRVGVAKRPDFER